MTDLLFDMEAIDLMPERIERYKRRYQHFCIEGRWNEPLPKK